MSKFNPAEIKQKARAAAQRALYEAGEKVAQESQKTVPRDTGELAKSIYVKTDIIAKNVSCEVGYMAEHAPYVHDGNGRGAGFLKKPFDETCIECEKIIQSAVEEAVR